MSKNIDYWENVLANLPAAYVEWFNEEKKYLEKIITPNSRVLEVGCGNGRTINDILHLTQNITGIDNDEKAVNDAKLNFSKNKMVKILKADAANLPFENESFDFVICMTTFANFADKKYVILKEMKRVLKTNGKIIISVFSEDALPERLKVYKNAGVKIKSIKNGIVYFDFPGANISEQFTEEELRAIFHKANFKINDITKVNIAYLCNLSKLH